MSLKSSIDVKRDAAISAQVGTIEDGPITTVLPIGDNLYVIKEKAIYVMQLADQIDPERKNPSIPKEVQQRVLAIGSDSELVARTLLTAKNLFDPHLLSTTFDVQQGLRFALDALNNLAAMHKELANFKDEEQKAILTFMVQQQKGESFALPVIGDVASKFKAFIQKADHTIQSLFNILKLFFGEAVKKGWFTALAAHSVKQYGEDDSFTAFLRDALPTILFIRDTRNAIEHPDMDKWVKVTDFTLSSDGTIVKPSFEVMYKEMHGPPNSITLAMDHLIKEILTIFEVTTALACGKHLQPFSGFPIQLIHLREDQRREKHVRFAYGVHLNGEWVQFG